MNSSVFTAMQKEHLTLRLHRLILGLLAAAGFCCGTINAFPLTESTVAVQPESGLIELWARQLLLLFDPSAANPTQAEVLQAVAQPDSNPDLVRQLNSPVAAERLLQFTSSPEVLESLAANPRSARAKLERYVVLTYATAEIAATAFSRLRADQRVSSVQQNHYHLYSPAPNDQYFPYGSGLAPGAYQWGMQALNFPAAWGVERGTAYVADLDIGIYCAGGTVAPCVTHPDLQQNFREQFSANFYAGDTTIAEHIFAVPGVGNFTGHGTHVAGILAATPEYGAFTNHNANSGVAGGCWTCSLVEIKDSLSDAATANSITYAVEHGLQILNMSFGDAESTPQFAYCGDTTNDSTCTAMAYADDRDVLVAAASGNKYVARIQFPAQLADTIAVGGLDFGGTFWRDGYGASCTPGSSGNECGSDYGLQSDGVTPQVVAPAKDVLSTFHYGYDYNPGINCGDTYGPSSGAIASGYGDCTGTSMSSPHVAAIVALMRSANPLMSKANIKTALLASTSPCTGTDSTKCGAGIPDAAKAVQSALGPGAKNRLTALFSFYSATADDHLYTIFPQMALAALYSGQMIPQPPSASIAYSGIGSTVPGYALYPQPSSCASPCPAGTTPQAIISVFTSHVDPTDATAELVPLYRMSYSCPSACVHVSHVYTTDSVGLSAFGSAGYVLDGIEGYIYPSSKAQPAGTVKLCRKYNSTRDDYILFTGTGTGGTTCGSGDTFTLNGSGTAYTDYTSPVGGTDWIGWVYPVRSAMAICTNAIPCSTLAAILSIISNM
jgi:serine protease